MKVYVVEKQSPYDGGGSEAVFTTLKKARKYCEEYKYFTEWDKPPYENDEKNKGDNFHLNIIEYELNDSSRPEHLKVKNG